MTGRLRRLLAARGATARIALLLTSLGAIALLAAPVGAAGDETFMAVLSGQDEVPAVSTMGTGTAYVFITQNGTEIRYALSFSGLTGTPTRATLNRGRTGSVGPIALMLQSGASTVFGRLGMSEFRPTPGAASWDALLAAIRTGETYINLETPSHPAGEVRGSVVPGSPAPSGDASATPSVTATPRVTATATVTAGMSATPRGTSGPSTSHTAPPTDTDPALGPTREPRDINFVLIACVAIVAGIVIAMRIRPSGGRRRP